MKGVPKMGNRKLWLAVDADGELSVWYGTHAPVMDEDGIFLGCEQCLFVGDGEGVKAIAGDMGVELPEPGTVVEQQISPIGAGCCRDEEDWNEDDEE